MTIYDTTYLNTLSEIRSTLEQLADVNFSGDRPALIIRLGLLFEIQFVKQNSAAAAIIQSVEISVNEKFDTIIQEFSALKTMLVTRQHTLEQLVSDRHDATSNKIHTISNHIMALENHINDLVELLDTDERSNQQT